MTTRFGLIISALLLAGCNSAIPDSNPRGVGFSNVDVAAAQAREAELAGQPLPSNARERTIGSETIAVLDATDTGPTPVFGEPLSAISVQQVPVQADPAEFIPVGTDAAETAANFPAAGAAAPNNSGISDEQDFSAVSSRESIESDAERRAQQQAAYEVIQPTALPTRDGSGRPNVVAFALSTTNAVGENLYRRVGFNQDARFTRACGEYPSQDRAQEDFLAAGGPERDRRGMDPDGDGFACFWDPAPYRTARGANN